MLWRGMNPKRGSLMPLIGNGTHFQLDKHTVTLVPLVHTESINAI